MQVQFSGDYVAELSTNGSKLPVVRLEPLLIGGLYPKNLEDRILISIDQAPPFLLDTLVTVEDRDFYHHFGVSPKSIARAMWVNTSSGQMRQGGSTLTQQLVKNFYLTNERSLSRKLTEAMMALLLELHYDKREVLGVSEREYLSVRTGSAPCTALVLASQFFFSQPLAEL